MSYVHGKCKAFVDGQGLKIGVGLRVKDLLNTCRASSREFTLQSLTSAIIFLQWGLMSFSLKSTGFKTTVPLKFTVVIPSRSDLGAASAVLFSLETSQLLQSSIPFILVQNYYRENSPPAINCVHAKLTRCHALSP